MNVLNIGAPNNTTVPSLFNQTFPTNRNIYNCTAQDDCMNSSEAYKSMSSPINQTFPKNINNYMMAQLTNFFLTNTTYYYIRIVTTDQGGYAGNLIEQSGYEENNFLKQVLSYLGVIPNWLDF